MDVVKCCFKAMDRQIGEGCFILSPEADLLMYGKLDHMQPAVGRVVVSTSVYSGRRRGRNPGGARNSFSRQRNVYLVPSL